MFITPFFRFGLPQDAPTLTLISVSTDHTPNFLVSGDLAEGDTVRLSYSTDSGFSGATEITNTIDAAEDAANSLDFSTGTLANATWYFRVRVERPPRGITAWSNVESETIMAGGGPISLFGRWWGGFGFNDNFGGYTSLFGRWLGGMSGTPAVTATEERPPPRPDQPAGSPVKKHTGPYAPAFRSVRDIYQPVDFKREAERLAPKVEQPPPKPMLKLGPSPLPQVMNIGGKPVMMGIKVSLTEQLLTDDEDAIIAILLSQ